MQVLLSIFIFCYGIEILGQLGKAFVLKSSLRIDFAVAEILWSKNLIAS